MNRDDSYLRDLSISFAKELEKESFAGFLERRDKAYKKLKENLVVLQGKLKDRDRKIKYLKRRSKPMSEAYYLVKSNMLEKNNKELKKELEFLRDKLKNVGNDSLEFNLMCDKYRDKVEECVRLKIKLEELKEEPDLIETMKHTDCSVEFVDEVDIDSLKKAYPNIDFYLAEHT